MPERINGNSLDAMMGTGPTGNAIVLLLLFLWLPCRPLPVGSDEQGRAGGPNQLGNLARPACFANHQPHQPAKPSKPDQPASPVLQPSKQTTPAK